jgi:hypothetical protein
MASGHFRVKGNQDTARATNFVVLYGTEPSLLDSNLLSLTLFHALGKRETGNFMPQRSWFTKMAKLI